MRNRCLLVRWERQKRGWKVQMRRQLKMLHDYQLLPFALRLMKDGRFVEALYVVDLACLVRNSETLCLQEAALLVKVLILIEMGCLEGALAVCNALLDQNCAHVEAYFRKAQILFFLERRQEALAAAQWVTTYDPDHLDAWMLQGDLHLDAGEWEAAFFAYTKALHCNEREPDQLLEIKRGQVLRQLGRHEEALVVYERAMALNPASQSVALLYVYKGMSLLSLCRERDALTAFEEASRCMEGNVQLRGDTCNARKTVSGMI